MLFSLYSAPEKPKINYPPVKTRPRGSSVGPPIEEKKCPQKTIIEYPEPVRKAGKKYHAVDFIPRRRPGEEIQAEMEEEMRRRPNLLPPGKRGVNRKQMINDLQERFQFKNKEELDHHIAMKKQAALLPEIGGGPRKKRGLPLKALQHYEEKYGRAPQDLLQARPTTKEEHDAELEGLFDTVVGEIEER